MAVVDSSHHAQQSSTNRLVLRNTMLLVGAKVLATPIAVLTNAVIARYLGPADYSYVYLATTYTTFGMLFVIFGQSGALPALVAVDRDSAGKYLGTALVWRAAIGVAVYAALALGCWAFGYDMRFQHALALVFSGLLMMNLAAACLEAIRGFERTDVDALTNVGTPLLTAALTIPIVLLGGRLLSVLTVALVVQAISLIAVSRFLRPVGVGALGVNMDTVKLLLQKGYPFLFFSGALALQTTVDAAFLSKLSPPEVVGWHAAANKLIGLVVFPASALVTALYPVLCRLFAENERSFLETTRATVQTAVLLMVPIAMCCGLFPEAGVLVLGKEGYAPIVDNLRVMAAFVFLVYVSMPLGIAVLAAGRARVWSAIQGLCVVVSLILDPLLVPMFQASHGNGGLGICWARVASEVLMVVSGLVLLPKGALGSSIVGPVGKAALGGVLMAGVAWCLKSQSFLWVAPLTLVVYLGVLRVTGGLNREQLAFLKGAASRRRKVPASS
jgi:O-antigen/teichoic acid export membrane protein